MQSTKKVSVHMGIKKVVPNTLKINDLHFYNSLSKSISFMIDEVSIDNVQTTDFQNFENRLKGIG